MRLSSDLSYREQRCANPTCRNTFSPNRIGRPRQFCHHRCAALMSYRWKKLPRKVEAYRYASPFQEWWMTEAPLRKPRRD